MFKRMMTALLCALLPLTCLAEELSTPAAAAYTPGRESCGKPNCFWETPMDYTDTEAMWAMLTAPMTVIDGNFRTQVHLMAEPSRDSQEAGRRSSAIPAPSRAAAPRPGTSCRPAMWRLPA